MAERAWVDAGAVGIVGAEAVGFKYKGNLKRGNSGGSYKSC